MHKIGDRIIAGHTGEKLEVQISAPRPKGIVKFAMYFFIPLWLVCWIAGGIVVLWSSITGTAQAHPAFILIWLVFWAASIVCVLFVLMKLWLGKEIITITPSAFQISNIVLKPFRTFSAPLGHVKNLRASGLFSPLFSWEFALAQWGLAGGNIAVDIQGKTYRFGIGCTEEEALSLVNYIKESYPILSQNR